MKVDVKYHLGDQLQIYATIYMRTGFLEFDEYFSDFASHVRNTLGYEVCSWEDSYVICTKVENCNIHKTLALIEQTYTKVKKQYDAKPGSFSLTIR